MGASILSTRPNRTTNCQYVIRARIGNGGIKEISELPNKECDFDFAIPVTTSHAKYLKDLACGKIIHKLYVPYTMLARAVYLIFIAI